MSFVSYAQNFEDVMLWRALKHIENGLYVDVGAQHPVIDSVSKAFYERGWRGIHIEPVPQYAELLRKDRPDETVLQVALADTEGTLDLNVIPGTGLSTFVDAYAHDHQVQRGYECQRIQVPVLTLKSALRSLAGKDVHWLKIDVEGFEEKVLKGWDSQSLRPWIIVVEATIPNSPELDYAGWEPILIAAGYQFVYFDGLNRFYVAKEHAELAEAFFSPPNFFDDVVLTTNSYLCRGLITSHQAREKDLVMRAENLAAELAQLKSEHELLAGEVKQLQRQVAEYENSLRAQQEAMAATREELTEVRAARGRLVEETTELKAKVRFQEEIVAARDREIYELAHSESYRFGLFCTWPLRKIWRAILHLREARSVQVRLPEAGQWVGRFSRWAAERRRLRSLGK